MLPHCEEICGMLEENEGIDTSMNKSQKLLVLYDRRAMVNKLWCQEIRRRWQQQRQEVPHARLLTEPKCQEHVANWYLFYRWLVFLTWSSFMVCSLFEFGSYQPIWMLDKWPIYLTNWDMLLGFIQALVGAILVTKRWRLQKVPGFNPHELKLNFTERYYWFLYVVTTNMAIGVTITYWIAVYNPEINQLDPLNIMLHVCNSVLMMIDFFVTSIPFRLGNFWWCLPVVVSYLIFSVIYYAAGGLDKHGYHYIYKILNWKEPVLTLLACAGGLIFVTVLHCVLCILANFKNRLYHKITEKLNKFSKSTTEVRDKTLTEIRTEMI